MTASTQQSFEIHSKTTSSCQVDSLNSHHHRHRKSTHPRTAFGISQTMPTMIRSSCAPHFSLRYLPYGTLLLTKNSPRSRNSSCPLLGLVARDTLAPVHPGPLFVVCQMTLRKFEGERPDGNRRMRAVATTPHQPKIRGAKATRPTLLYNDQPSMSGLRARCLIFSSIVSHGFCQLLA